MDVWLSITVLHMSDVSLCSLTATAQYTGFQYPRTPSAHRITADDDCGVSAGEEPGSVRWTLHHPYLS